MGAVPSGAIAAVLDSSIGGGDSSEPVLLSSLPSGAVPMAFAGRYNFTVLAGNEARPYGEFGTQSAVSSQLIVGAHSCVVPLDCRRCITTLHCAAHA